MVGLLLIGVGLGGACAQAADEEFVALFDGKSLQGWQGNQDVFRVDDGAIVGGTLRDRVPRNEFLTAAEEYGDFELRLEFKVLGEGANAGIQLRSQRVPNHHEMTGYQADLGEGWWGCLYDESRRNKVLAGPPADQRAEPVRQGDWNEYVIRCEGPRIQLWINGKPTVDYTETDAAIPQKGLIGLQIHGGGPSEAWYRNIRIRKLGTP